MFAYSVIILGEWSGGLFVCWSLTSLCHSNGHIETMPAREINPFTALTRIRSQFFRTQWSTSNHSEWTRLRLRPLSHRGWQVIGWWSANTITVFWGEDEWSQWWTESLRWVARISPQGSNRSPRYCSVLLLRSHFHCRTHPEDSSSWPLLVQKQILGHLSCSPTHNGPSYRMSSISPPQSVFASGQGFVCVWHCSRSGWTWVLVKLRTSPILVSARSTIVESSIPLLPVYPWA